MSAGYTVTFYLQVAHRGGDGAHACALARFERSACQDRTEYGCTSNDRRRHGSQRGGEVTANRRDPAELPSSSQQSSQRRTSRPAVRELVLRGALAVGLAGLVVATTLPLNAAPALETGDQMPVAAAACSGVASDFNGDGIRDIAIADPEATVSGIERAGLVHIVYGGGMGTLELSQETPNISDGAESGDEFGFSIAVYDANLDGCSDIAVGIPYEDVGAVKDAGLVHLVYGAPAGLGQGTVASVGLRQGTDGKLAGGYEAEDWVGYALAAGKSISNFPFLVVGVPGEDGPGGADIGIAHYVYGTDLKSASFGQDSAGVWEDAEPYDRFGTSIASTDRHFAVGVPGESMGTVQFAGGVNAFRPSLNTDGIPAPMFGMGQGRVDGPDSAAQDGDRYGTSLAMAPYRPGEAATITDSMLAVGAPGEDLSTTVDAGAVQVYHIKADQTVVQTQWVDQNAPDVEGEAEPGDFFGQRVAAVNTTTNVVSTASTMRLAVGVPGEEYEAENRENGGVALFSMLGAPGAADSWIEPGHGIPAEPAPRQYVGMSLGSTPSLLYVGMPYGPAQGRGVYGFPWNTASGGAPTQTFKPGVGGLPTDVEAFGATVR
ncbi:FG-GAP repeat domain-containing protein [Streptomyces sp. NPDC102473]|uniref:FG-GAP repeat domain-containing protein n=1 Tax=Streptomyces sp. NPDC102473 TaxID=3366180 RepID=UPI003825F89B